jgi:hypothetical protein
MDTAKEREMAKVLAADPTGVIFRHHYYGRITKIEQVSRSTYRITMSNGHVYRLEGGKHAGGSRTDWFLDGGFIGEKAIPVTGMRDALKLLQSA